MSSAYCNYRTKNGELKHPKFTNYTDTFQGTLDYIFYHNNHQLGLQCVNTLLIPKAATIQQGCPNYTFPSDHFPIVADFNYNHTS